MTVIVGIETPNGVVIGGDRQRTGGTRAIIADHAKVELWAPWLGFGNSGSPRFSDVIRYAVKPEWLTAERTQAAIKDPRKWLITELVPRLREATKEAGTLHREHETEDTYSSTLIGIRGQLYHCSADWQIFRRQEHYDAVGCGQGYALGHLHAWAGTHPLTAEAVSAAIATACHFDSACGGPVDLITVAP